MLTIDILKKNNLILFECISGSKAYGLHTEKSDTDIRGVFYMPKKDFYGLNYVPQVSNETNDIVYYELGRFIELLSKNNPNILEMLATPAHCVIYKIELMNEIKIADFLSLLTKDTFVGYALSQIKKARGLNKKMFHPMNAQRKTALAFCYVVENGKTHELQKWLIAKKLKQENCGLAKINHLKDTYNLFYNINEDVYSGICVGKDSNEVTLSRIPKTATSSILLYFNKDAYSTYCKKYSEYWEWVSKRNIDRFQTNKLHGKGYDTKNMMHTIRLLQVALNIFKNNKLTIEVENREELLAIKSGVLSYEEVIKMADDLIVDIEKFYKKSILMKQPDLNKIENLLIELRLKLYN
ncbi:MULTISPECIES: DNA polymerase beta superfamily protein [unclassified Flavobacterium]|uniref:DNA polymerase beta superfamily protein n=1 Tax=unclassified Flavobacterium TaxID=196869 RepID=UPI0029CAB2EE|nr:nucleotidyltransferase domain-containing protein [Flavobacterium sp. N2155]